MANLPVSDKDVERFKTTFYVKPEPLTLFFILILLIFFPIGFYYLVCRKISEYMVNRYKTDQEREALFFYVKKELCEYHATDTVMHIPTNDSCSSQSLFSLMGPWSFVPGTLGYNLKNGTQR